MPDDRRAIESSTATCTVDSDKTAIAAHPTAALHEWPVLSTTRQVLLVLAMTLAMMLNVGVRSSKRTRHPC